MEESGLVVRGRGGYLNFHGKKGFEKLGKTETDKMGV